MNFVSVKELNLILTENLYLVPEDVDLIVGIPRSGMLVANLLALYLNLPLTDIDNFKKGIIYSSGTTKVRENWIKNISAARRILVLDDSVATGQSMLKAKKLLNGDIFSEKIIYGAVFVTEESKKYVDIWMNVCPMPRVFEWNFQHHMFSDKFCYDIDGVLCVDPKDEENDDGDKYIEFLKNAKPIIIPTYTIGCLVTCRLEKYRKLTEEWLRNNNIKYNKLIMMNYKTKEERIKYGNHGIFKAELFKSMSDMLLFVESDPSQAEIIAQISGKSVFCTGNRMYYKENRIHHFKQHHEPTLKNFVKRILVFILPTCIYNKLVFIKNQFRNF